MMLRIINALLVVIFVGTLSFNPLKADEPVSTAQQVAADDTDNSFGLPTQKQTSNVLDCEEEEETASVIGAEDGGTHKFNLDDFDGLNEDEDDID